MNSVHFSKYFLIFLLLFRNFFSKALFQLFLKVWQNQIKGADSIYRVYEMRNCSKAYVVHPLTLWDPVK